MYPRYVLTVAKLHPDIAELFRSLACGRSDDRFGPSLTTEIAIRPVRICGRSLATSRTSLFTDRDHAAWKALRQRLDTSNREGEGRGVRGEGARLPASIQELAPSRRSDRFPAKILHKRPWRASQWNRWTLAGRVEDWRGIPKAWPSRFSPFPLGMPP
jgi:hypothetical protein